MVDLFEKATGPVEGGLQSLEELNGYQVVRSEFISPTFRPKMSLNINKLVFSSTCMRLFENVQYILPLVSEPLKRVVIRPCGANERSGLRWCNIRNGKAKPRYSTLKFFGAKIFDMMKWIPENRYKVQAVYQELNGVQLLVFNLKECEMVVPETVTKDDGTKTTIRKQHFPPDWKESFGMTYAEYTEAYRVDIKDHYLSFHNDGTSSEYSFSEKEIEGKPLSDQDIIMRQYAPATKEHKSQKKREHEQ